MIMFAEDSHTNQFQGDLWHCMAAKNTSESDPHRHYPFWNLVSLDTSFSKAPRSVARQG